MRWTSSLFFALASFSLVGCQGGEPEKTKDFVAIDTVKTDNKASAIADSSPASPSPEEQERIRILIAQEHEKALAKKNSIPPPGPDPYQWIQDAQDIYGESAAPGTVFRVTDEGNCGGPGGGCTFHVLDTDTIGVPEIYISPSAIGSVHLLFHEIAHSHGVMDECMAEKWAHTVTELDEWSYPECAPND